MSAKPPPDLLRLFVRPIHDAGLPYLAVGSVGSIFYGEPRLTLDVDLAVAFSSAQACRLPSLFSAEDFYVPPAETLTAEAGRPRGHWNLIHHGSGLKADFYACPDDPFFRWAWENRHTARLEHGEIHYAPAEFIVVGKVGWFAEGGGDKHVRDIRRMLELAAEPIDRRRIEGELSRRGLLEAYRQILGP